MPARVGVPRQPGLAQASAPPAFLDADPEAELWLARDERGETIGRVGANRSRGDHTSGYAGFFDVEAPGAGHPDAGDALVAAATSWLEARAVARIFAPVNLSTWFAYRFRSDDDPRTFAWEPQQPAWYAPAFARAGFAEVARYHSDAFAGDAFARAVLPSRARTEAMGYRFRPFSGGTHDLATLHRITQLGFSGSFLFEPLPFALFRALYVPVFAAYDARPSRFLVDPRGEDVGFLFAFADGDALVYKSIALLAEARGKGLSGSLFHVAWEEATRASNRVRQVITALVRTGAQSESYTRKAACAWRHDYVLLGRTVAAAEQGGRHGRSA